MSTKVASLYAEIGAKTDSFESGAARVLGGLGKLVTNTTVLTAALTVMKGSFDMAQQGAQLERLSDTGAEMARQLGGNLDEIVRKVKAASLNTVSDMDIIASANKAMMLGLGADADQLANLMQVAALRGRAMGISTTQAFDDIVRGIGRTSPLILDNLGIVVNAKTTYEEYAKGIGKSSGELTRQEKIQALLNRVLDEGNQMLAKAGGLAEDNATQFERLSASTEDYKNSVKLAFSEAVSPTIEGLFDYAKAMDEATAATGRADPRSRMYLASIQLEIDKHREAQERINKASSARLNAATAMYQYKDAVDETVLSQEELEKSEKDYQMDLKNRLDQIIGLTDSTKNFVEKQNGIKEKQDEIKEKINGLIANGWNPLSEKVQDLQKEYDDLTQKYDDNAAAHEEATKRKLLDMALEKIAMLDGVKGFSDGEYEKALAVAKTMGAAEEASVREQMAFDQVTTAIANGTARAEDMNKILELMAKGYSIDVAINISSLDRFNDLYTKLQGTPYWQSEKMYRPQKGYATGTDGWQTVPPGYPNDNYMIGLTSGEKFSVVPPEKIASNAAMSGGNAGGSTVNISVTVAGGMIDPEELAYKLGPAMRRVLRAENLI